jgi:cyclopropane-fatty-acyl-phospholipid synthase
MASYMPSIITKSIAYGTDMLRSAIGGISWLPVLNLSRTAVTALFARIDTGTLLVIDEVTGRTESYGQKIAREDRKVTNILSAPHKMSAGPGRVELLVRKESFWVRVFLFADMGFAEAFMLGEVDCPDLTSFFQVS